MFLTYTNELVFILEKHNIKVKLFADDVKMYIKIVNDVDMQQLQLDVHFYVVCKQLNFYTVLL